MSFSKTIAILLGLGLACSSILAQTEDSLSSLSTQELAITGTRLLRGSPNEAIRYFDYLIKSGGEKKDTTAICIGYELKGEASRVMGKLDTALHCAQEANRLIGSIDFPALEIEILMVLGNIYSDRGDEKKVMSYYFEAIQLAEKKNLLYAKISIEQGLAYFKSSIGKIDEAIEDLHRIKRQITTIGASQNFAEMSYYQNDVMLAKVYWDNNQPDSTVFYANRALDVSYAREDYFTQQILYMLLGTSYARKGESKKGLSLINIGDSISVAMGNQTTISSIRYHKAKILFDIKEYSKILPILEKIVLVSEEQQLFYEERAGVYNLLAKTYKELGYFEEANSNFEKYIELYELEKKKSQNVADSFKDKEIAVFKQELHDIQQEKDTQKNYLYYIGFGSLFIIMGLLLRIRQNKQQNTARFQALIEQIESKKISNTTVINTKNKLLEENTTLAINEETTAYILTGLERMEKSNYFLKQDCNAYNVAKRIKTNTSYLSKVVNAHFKKNFNTYINDLRINYALVQLKEDATFRMYTIQSIANDLGYKSADSFSKYFKKRTGLLPSFYIKQLNSLEKS